MPYASKAQQRLAGSTNYEASESTLTSTSKPEMTSMADDKTKLTGGRIGSGKASAKTGNLKGGTIGTGGRKNSGALTGGRIGGGMARGK